jgi:hypothetical protein
MRRIHWWGGAVGAGVIATAAFVAPTAYAAPRHHPPRKPTIGHAKVLVRHGKVVKVLRLPHDPGHHHHHHHGHGGCNYPPSGTASVTLNGPDHLHVGIDRTLSGSVKVNSCGYAGFATGLYVSADGKTGWTLATSTSSNDAGAFTFSFMSATSVYVRAVVAGGAGYGTTTSSTLYLPVKPLRH